MSERIKIAVTDGVARVTLNRADKRNALDMEMFNAIASAQKELRRTKGLRVVIIDGEGPDFCSGLDVGSVMKNRKAALSLLWKWLPWRPNLAQAVSVGWRRLNVPVIAVLHGRCWGGGMQIALGADFRLAHPGTSLSIMEGRWGLIPDMGGTLALRDIMPRDQAMQLAMTAEEIDPKAALDLGLITAVSPDPMQAALDLAKKILDRSPDAVAAAKRLYRKSWGSEGSTLFRETYYQMRILTGANQGIAIKRQMGKDSNWRPAGRW